ncbi:MAG: trypsin-like serine peptidase, partial [Pseudomonadales bacterium]
MNVNCPDGASWVNERNSVVMLVSGSSGFCTGALVNNVLNDGKPYVLTANHCYDNPASWVFRFNWEAVACNNPGGSPSFLSLSGAVLRSRRTPTDFCLVEITGGLTNNTVPASHSPFFAGWDNSGDIPSTTVCIHHPAGDIKKISFDDDAASVSQSMGSSEANSTWTVQWDRNTTTEGGSSGSPLFDQNHRVIGQLWGGGASCNNLNAPDYYGRFSQSWEPTSSNQTNQLKHWLDPNGLGAGFIDGFDPSGASAAEFDAGVSNASLVETAVCATDYTPSFTLSNPGSETLTSAVITYDIDGGAPSVLNWSGSLAQYQTEAVILSVVVLSAGSHALNIEVSSPNGSPDENANNDVSVANINIDAVAETALYITVSLLTDDYADETYMEITNSVGAVIWTEGNEEVAGNFGTGNFPPPADPTAPLENNTQYDWNVPLPSQECYTFSLYDYYGDGLGASQWQGTDGGLNLKDNFGSVIYTISAADFGGEETSVFRNLTVGFNYLTGSD